MKRDRLLLILVCLGCSLLHGSSAEKPIIVAID